MGIGKKIIPALAIIAILIGAAFCIKIFVLDRTDIEEPNPSESPAPEDVLPTPALKTSYLFRDDILGRNKEDVLETLDVEDGETMSEDILSRNVETTYKWNNTSLEAVYSTVSVEDAKGYNYSRNHQTAVDEAISFTGTMPESLVVWKDENERVYDNNLWNTALEKGDLILADKFNTPQGSLLIITCNKKFDDDIKRSRTEKVFTSVIIGTEEYIDGFIKNNV